MIISFVEIQNFRKLKSIRIDFNERETLLVGANNSGKTSATIALGHFLVNPKRFSTNDFTLSNWIEIEKIGTAWVKGEKTEENSSIQDWEQLLPQIDVWLKVEANEIHHVRHLIPTLSWNGGLIGVRMRYEPGDIKNLRKEFLAAYQSAAETRKTGGSGRGSKPYTLNLWPESLRGYLDKKLNTSFAVRSYLLDASKTQNPEDGHARPQVLANGSEPLDVEPFNGLIRIDEVSAQRGLGQPTSESTDESSGIANKRKLSEQLKSYYTKHLDPSDSPAPADLDALEAIEGAQKVFEDRLAASFSEALDELSKLNYPGITDPQMKIITRIRPADGLNHSTAVQYDVLGNDSDTVTIPLRLPEEYNGLGFQNLISIVFRLMSFRDAWMRVGKASKVNVTEANILPPLHLVLIEEPEAHLHAQVQQVFIRKAYGILRKHKDLGGSATLRTQLIVSTHSSHVAHECDFSILRYFRRLPSSGKCLAPTTVVINMSEVFGPNDESDKFVARYLKATHCDLFFADAAILFEGPAERMLVPHFIKKHFDGLHGCYVTLLEIGGSHSHKLKPLIERLGLTTLIITDLDSLDATGKATPPKRKSSQKTGNSTLKTWHPQKEEIDDLLDIDSENKVKRDYATPLFSVRVAYQCPLKLKDEKEQEVEVLSTTFEDSLVLENIELFKKIDGNGMIKKFKELLNRHTDIRSLDDELIKIVREGDKAAFALDLLFLEKEPDIPFKLSIPAYIKEGLAWLEGQLKLDQKKILNKTNIDVPKSEEK